MPTRRTTRRLLMTAAVAATALFAVAVPASGATEQADAATSPRVSGSAKIFYQYSPNDDIMFEFDARGFVTDATGTFHFRHTAGSISGEAWGTIDCLIVGGNVATLTGVVTKTTVPDFDGLRLGFSVADQGRHDRLGFNWGLTELPDNAPRCAAPAPFTTVVSGNYVVRDAPLPNPPTW